MKQSPGHLGHLLPLKQLAGVTDSDYQGEIRSLQWGCSNNSLLHSTVLSYRMSKAEREHHPKTLHSLLGKVLRVFPCV